MNIFRGRHHALPEDAVGTIYVIHLGILTQGGFITPNKVYGQVPNTQIEHTSLTIGDIICIRAEEYIKKPELFGYRETQGNMMGVYAYKSIYLDEADGRIQSELTRDLHFHFLTAGEKMQRNYPHIDIVITIYDADGSDTLAPTPFGPTGTTTYNMITFHGLQDYLRRTPNYEKLPYSNTTIIVNLHKYNGKHNLEVCKVNTN